jgi:asparagine synthase (glutamine-hydrolysing)
VDLPRWRRRFRPFASVPGLGRVARPLIRAVAPGLARRAPKALGLLEYASSWAGTYLLRRGLFLPYELKEVMDPETAREGLRRLKPLRRLTATLSPDPGSDVGRVCLLESAHYMRNQLLRDADWAGMAHGVEIRVPLVDVRLLDSIAPFLPGLTPGAGKAALATAPARPLPDEIVTRAKTGFGVPTGNWLVTSLGRPGRRQVTTKGIDSRDWSRVIFGKLSAEHATA